jgi:hypothetical protein
LATLRLPLLVFAAIAARLRRLPGGAAVARRASWVAAGLLVLAFLAFVVWGLERAPQRVAMADLAAGALSPMQSWIIVSGDLVAQESRISTYGYLMTDAAVANASMTIFSDVELPLGPATVSGMFLGPREPVPPGHRWIGQMRADAIQVTYRSPPWVAIALGITALTVAAASRVPYPMFFARSPRNAAPRAMEVPVAVRRGQLTQAQVPVQCRLRVDPGASVTLHPADGPAQQLRLHSAHTGYDVGELQYLSSAAPAMQVRQSTDELTITFATSADRDATAAALVADATGWARAPQPEST